MCDSESTIVGKTAVSAILLPIPAGIACWSWFGIHPALCLLIGIGLVMAIILLGIAIFIAQTETLSVSIYLVLSTIASLIDSLVVAFTVYCFTNGDYIWFYVLFGLLFVICILIYITSIDAEVYETTEVEEKD